MSIELIPKSELVEERFLCEICHKTFKQKVYLKRHQKSSHESSNSHPCSICNREFKRISDLKRHIKLVHLKSKSKSRKAASNNLVANSNTSQVCFDLQHNDNSSNMCNGSIIMPDDNSNSVPNKYTGIGVDNQESFVSQHDDILNNTCDITPAPKQFTPTKKAKKQKEPPKNRNYGAHIKCLECNTRYNNIQLLRNHLYNEHNLNMDRYEYHFPNMAAFQKWKHDIERQDLSYYILRHGSKKTKTGIKNAYCCHRSGKFDTRVSKRKRMAKTTGSAKLGIICTSSIVCEDRPEGVVVYYYPQHYGHGKELSFVNLTPEEQDAIQENVSKGIPFENLLEDIKDNQSSADHYQLYLIKKKDARFISNAYAADEYNPGMGEMESVDQWVRQCSEMENSPILYYRPDDSTGKSKTNFLLIIMTEFQRQILMTSAKQVVCVDSVSRKIGKAVYLTVLIVMDDKNIAFPVAFCLSIKVDKNTMLQFFISIMESTGPLSFEYFLSDTDSFIYDAWKEVMEDDQAKWLWSMWHVENRIRMQLKVFRDNVIKKAEAYKTMRTLLECQNVNVFESMFKTYVDNLKSEPNSKSLGEYMDQKYGKHVNLWAYCYRKDIPLSTNIHLDVLHRSFHFCCREGRKKRLDKFLFVVMKLVKYKMLDRLCNVLDEEKTRMAIEAINICHNEGLEITSEHILSLSERIWTIEGKGEQNIYVMREFETCPEHCSLRCKECDICVHMYTCSCLHSVINANMCPHIHAVVWKFLTPHFSPPPSPVVDDVHKQENIDVSDIPDKCSELLEEILNKSHDVYKIVRENKCSLPNDSLIAILKRLNECIDIGKGKEVIESAVSNAQNVLSVVLPKNCQDLSQYVIVLPNNESSASNNVTS